MNSRVPALALGMLVVLALASKERLTAQEETPPSELAALKQVVEDQGRRIDALSAQVTELIARLETKAPADEPTTVPPAIKEAAPLVATPLAMSPEPNFYVVAKGDSLEKIAKTWGTTTAELQKLNAMANPNKLQVGQKILLPAGLSPKTEP